MRYAVPLPERGYFEIWREAARRAISHRIPPSEINWDGAPSLFPEDPLPEAMGPHQPKVGRDFLRLAQSVSWHAAPERFSLLYQALWRLDQGGPSPLLDIDPLGRKLSLMAKAVSRDIHKMHAFVRFRELPPISNRRHFAAWFEPDHHTLEPGTSFFAKRFHDMDWMIATPGLSAVFRDGALIFAPGGARPDLPEDASAALWDTYFANIFNPARVKLKAMRSEMPEKYWRNLPETRLIPAMLKDAEARVARMHAAGATPPRPGAAAVATRYRETLALPESLPETLSEAAAAARHCQRCGLCEAASQTVWGEGPADARLMILGEQPGDREDLEGRPFIGPAGQLLRSAMGEAGIDPAATYLTNAVKHFKFTPRGRQRLHKTPDRGEIEHCRWWLGLELALLRPKLVVALGASAAFASTGDAAPLTRRRGRIETGLHEGKVLISWHPAHILRLPSKSARETARRELIEDLARAATWVTDDHR